MNGKVAMNNNGIVYWPYTDNYTCYLCSISELLQMVIVFISCFEHHRLLLTVYITFISYDLLWPTITSFADIIVMIDIIQFF